MAVSFLVQPDRHPLGAHPATRRPQLVGLDGGRSVAAVRRRRVFLVRRCVVGVLAVVAIVLAGSAVSAVSSALSPDVREVEHLSILAYHRLFHGQAMFTSRLHDMLTGTVE